jgi:hypothetical protein
MTDREFRALYRALDVLRQKTNQPIAVFMEEQLRNVFRTSRPQVEVCERVCKQRSIEGILGGAEAAEGLLFIVCWRGPIGSGLRVVSYSKPPSRCR